tara:strand:+ start:67 stop:336 length:270 start_codon:yes stop_codon:yes gene_type:complete
MEIKGWGHSYQGETTRDNVPRLDGMVFEVDEDRCFGCAACIALCPVDALRLEDLMVYVDEPVCTHCKLCIPACPVFALDIMRNPMVVVG